MSETPICDKHKYETDLGAEVVPFRVAIELEFKLHQRELEIGEANAKWLNSDKQLAEARAEIERLNKHWSRVEERLNGMLYHSDWNLDAAQTIIKRKDKLIEQMREALKSAEVVIDFYEANNKGAGRGIGKMIKAALAAERNE